jgi:DNA-binding transcriptional LysR family regulator
MQLMPTARQLETFLTIARLGSLRAAADEMGVSQPTVSKQLLALERKLGFTLFHRKRGSSAQLTEQGRSVLRQAEETLSGQTRLGRQARRGRFPRFVTVLMRSHLFSEIEPWIEDLGIDGLPTELNFEIIAALADFKERIAHDRDVVSLIRTFSPDPGGMVKYDVLEIDRCSLFVSSELADGADDLLSLPRDVPILLPEWGPLSELLMAHLKAAGAADRIFLPASPYIASLLRQVLDGKGAAVFMDLHVASHVSAGQLTRIGSEVAPMYLQFVSHPAMQPDLRRMIRDKLSNEILHRMKIANATAAADRGTPAASPA